MWYYEMQGSSRGPADIDEIRRLIGAGQISRMTRVWRDGFADWLPAGDTELGSAFATAPTASFVPAATPAYAPQPGYQVPAYAPVSPAGYMPASYAQAANAVGYSGVHYAGFWMRVLAYIIDAIFLQIGAFIIGGIVGGVIGAIAASSGSTANTNVVSLAGGLVGLLWALFYYSFIPSTSWQATPGKRICGIYIIRLSGRKIGFWFALGRYLSYIVSSLTLCIGFMMAGWNDQKKALHDMICDTRVIYGRP